MRHAGPVSAVQRYIEAFNKGDVKAMTAMCADPMSILDGMAPHVWHGPSAAQEWYRAVLNEGEHLGARHYHVTLSEPLHVNVTGEVAYVVVPATMAFKLKGRQVTQSGAVFTLALRNFAAALHRQALLSFGRHDSHHCVARRVTQFDNVIRSGLLRSPSLLGPLPTVA